MAIVAAVRPGEGEPLPATAFIHLDVLGRDAAAELVGPGRVDELYARSKGHPLFLTELAQQAAGAELPASLVESVSARCDELGAAGALLRTAAVIGPELDVDLLAAVLGRPVVALLDDAERAVAKQFLVDEDGTFRFRHELVREALAASATAGRAALLHRQAGRVLARRPGADPMMVAHHARLGGDLALASRALRDASARAAERFDHAAAEALLDDALRLHPDQEGWLARARVRTRRGRYAEALQDVERAAAAGAGRPGGRRLGVVLRPPLRAGRPVRRGRRAGRGGRGDPGPVPGRRRPDPARRRRPGPGRAAARRGVLARRGRGPGDRGRVARGAPGPSEPGGRGAGAAAPGRPRAGRGGAHLGHPARAAVHRARARAGRPPGARRWPRSPATPPRWNAARCRASPGRAVNFAGWVLRNLGAVGPRRSIITTRRWRSAQRQGTAEVTIAALEDLAEQCLDAGDPDGARPGWRRPRRCCQGDLVFGWRLRAQAPAHHGAAGPAARRRRKRALADGQRAGVARGRRWACPRYVSVARLLAHRANRALGRPVDLDAVAADLDLLDASVAIEAWWWTGEVAAELRPARPGWTGPRTGRPAGPHAGRLRGRAAPPEAARRLDALAGPRRHAEDGAGPAGAAVSPAGRRLHRLRPPTTRAPRRSRRAPSPSRTAPARPAGTAPSCRSHQGPVSMPQSSSASR